MKLQKHETPWCFQGTAEVRWLELKEHVEGDKLSEISRSFAARGEHAQEFELPPVGQQSQLWPHTGISKEHLKNSGALMPSQSNSVRKSEEEVGVGGAVA